MPSFPEDIVICSGCDLLQRIPTLPPGATACCPRCRQKVAFNKFDTLDRTLALTIAAFIVSIIANMLPLMKLSVSGRQSTTTILNSALSMWLQGQQITAALVLFCTLIAPVFHISLMLMVLLAVRRSPAPWWIGVLLRWSVRYEPWVMVEVMMLGILVALVKISTLATVIPGVGIFAIGALVLLLAAMTVSFDPQEAWKRVEWVSREALSTAASDSAGAGAREI